MNSSASEIYVSLADTMITHNILQSCKNDLDKLYPLERSKNKISSNPLWDKDILKIVPFATKKIKRINWESKPILYIYKFKFGK